MLGDFFYGKFFYEESVLLIGCGAFLILGTLLNFIGCLSGVCSKRKVHQEEAESDEEDSVSQFGEKNYELLNPTSTTTNKRAQMNNDYSEKRVFWVVTGVTLSWFGWIFFGLAVLWFASFGYLPRYASMLLMGFILLVKFWREIYKMCPILYRKRRVFRSSFISLKPLLKHTKIFSYVYSQHKCLLIFQIIFMLILSLFIPIFMEGTCLCFYNQSWGLPLFDGKWNYNTHLMRQFGVGRVCQPNEICHVYVTLPEEGTTSAFINLHTGVDVPSVTVTYTSVKEPNSLSVEASVQSFSVNGLDQLAARNLFTAYLEGLTPDTQYTIQIKYGNESTIKKIYKTPPDGDAKPLTLAIGGDVGNTETADTMTSMAARSLKPDVFYIGGNLAYDNNIRSCAFSYDKFIARFEAAYETLGYMIPLVLAIGDHDVGLNPQTYRDVPKGEKAPLYLIYFPQHLSTDPKHKVPALSERKSYHYHVIGNSVFTVLDTGYITPIEDQVTWLTTVSSEHAKYSKFACYHNPIYTPVYQDAPTQLITLSSWVPVFDTNKFMAAFESRKHVLKKTFQLRNNVKADIGTYYLGEGPWGATPETDCSFTDKTNVFDQVLARNHIWMVKFDHKKGSVEYSAYSELGESLIPKFSQKISDYKV